MGSQRALRRMVARAVQEAGMTITSEAARRLQDFVENNAPDSESWAAAVDHMVNVIGDRAVTAAGAAIDVAAVEQVEQLLENQADDSYEMVDDERSHLAFVDAFDLPRLRCATQGERVLIDSGAKRVFAGADDKTGIFRRRLEIIRQRLLRNRNFSQAAAAGRPEEALQLTSVESLLGSSGTRVVLGMLSQIREGRFYIEDATSHYPINLTGANCMAGFFTETCIVLAEGEFDGNVFNVSQIASPMPEARETTIRALGSRLNYSGVSLAPEAEASELRFEKEQTDAMFVFLSDVHLDQPDALEKLRTVLSGYDQQPPTLICLAGPFVSPSFGYAYDGSRAREYQSLFENLATLIGSFRNIVEQTKICIVPARDDVGPSQALPRPGIPEYFVKCLRRDGTDVYVGSNPMRFRYCTQEFVVFREDLLRKMRRSCVLEPNVEVSDNLVDHLVKTVVEQAHLCPLPIHKSPVYWDYDHALSLFPLPTVLVLCDSAPAFQSTLEGCRVFNPGSFANEFSFSCYYPHSRTDEMCQV